MSEQHIAFALVGSAALLAWRWGVWRRPRAGPPSPWELVLRAALLLEQGHPEHAGDAPSEEALAVWRERRKRRARPAQPRAPERKVERMPRKERSA